MELIVVTNNPLVAERFDERCEVRYFAVSLPDLLTQVRTLIHAKHRLLTHPLSGSVKPGETPYKSVLISCEPGAAVDAFSLELIESAIMVVRQMRALNETDAAKLDAYALVDCSLLADALPLARFAGLE